MPKYPPIFGGCPYWGISRLWESRSSFKPCPTSHLRKDARMAAEARLRELVDEHLDLGREPQWDGGLADSGVSSLAAVAFKKVVEQEFGVTVPPECFDTLRKLAAYIDSQAA
ncbi:MAG: acyl carrier protein [Gemmatimonadales bacterium]|nr:acyl carrier protein [Gemmatimonadales bacterium]MYG17997.1 acyl carrier protein [Gemmatimonadales bacterium]